MIASSSSPSSTSFRQFLVLALIALTASVTHALPSPSLSASSSPPVAAPIFGSDHALFGISHKVVATLRGGQVLTPETLEDVETIIAQSGGKLVVIDFFATWCGPCKMIAPLFQELSDAMTDVVFIKIDVDVNPDTAAKYNVSAMPTFLFLKQNQVVDRLMGASPARLQELIEEHK